MKRIFLMICLTMAGLSLAAQENMGIVHDNYAVTNGMLLNPSAIVDPKPFLEINLVGANLFLQNNYISTPRRDLLRGQVNPIYDPSAGNSINAFADISLQGPSASLNWGIHSFGISTQFRNYANVRKMPGRIAKMAFDGLEYDPSDNGRYIRNNARVKAMGWAEFGFSYGRILHHLGKDMWTGGITVKRLIGVHHTALIANRADVEVLSEDQFLTYDLEGRYAFSNPGWGAGKGWGADVGVTYKRMKEELTKYIPHSKKLNCKCPEYRYKLGLSLLDVGGIRFNRNAVVYAVDRNADVENVQSLDDLIGVGVSGEPTSNTYRAGLPTAFSGQFDYNFDNGFFANATMIYGMPRPTNLGVERTTIFAVTPRYEKKYFGVSMPLTVYNYTQPRVGLGLRVANLVIGSDHLLPWVFNQNLKGADIYFNLKYTIYKKSSCKDKPRKLKTKFCPQPGG